MSRDYKIYLNDILEASTKILKYTQGFSYNQFINEEMVRDAVLRNLEIIGEAVKNIPDRVKDLYPKIEWHKIAGLRNILIHEYFGVNYIITWDLIQNKVPILKADIENILRELN